MPSAPVPLTLGVRMVVVLSPTGALSEPASSVGAGGAPGGVPSIVSVTDIDRLLRLPAASRATAVMV